MDQYCSKVKGTFLFRDIFVKSTQMKGGSNMYHYQRLRDLREDEDLTQAQIAPMLDVSREQYSRWERGAQEIPMHHAITLAKFYRVSMDYICGLTNKKR